MPDLSEKGRELLGDLPPYLADDGQTQSAVDTVARELQRIEDSAVALRLKAFPRFSDDEFYWLSLWEWLLGLAVAPTGVSVEDRRNLVIARLRKRDAGSGLDWEEAVGIALGTDQWTYEEGPADYTITVSIPYASGNFTVVQAEALIRDFTPAHLDLNLNYAGAWLVGVSLVGVDPL